MAASRNTFIFVFSLICMLVLSRGIAYSQTNCIWIEESNNGTVTQTAGISYDLLKLLARSDSKFDWNGNSFSYDSLLLVCENNIAITQESRTDHSVVTIHGGKFRESMNEESDRHNYLFIENTEHHKKKEISKLRTNSLKAFAVLLATIGSFDNDENLDAIESSLHRGGVFYLRDFEKDKILWVYVN